MNSRHCLDILMIGLSSLDGRSSVHKTHTLFMSIHNEIYRIAASSHFKDVFFFTLTFRPCSVSPVHLAFAIAHRSLSNKMSVWLVVKRPLFGWFSSFSIFRCVDCFFFSHLFSLLSSILSPLSSLSLSSLFSLFNSISAVLSHYTKVLDW